MSAQARGGRIALAALLLVAATSPARGEAAAVTIAHRLTVGLDPVARQLSVDDRMLLLEGGMVEFVLNSQLEILSADPPVAPVPLGEVAPFLGNNSTSPSNPSQPGAGLRRYRVQLPEGGGRLHLTYSGKFDFGIGTQQEEYQRGFRDTAGIVSPEGVYLAGDGHWYAQFSHAAGASELVEFELTAGAPEGWQLVSQGNGSSRDELGLAHWSSGGPLDEIYLVGGPLVRYRQRVSMPVAADGGEPAAAVEAEVYLRAEDPALAAKYLQATAQYLEMYAGLIGPYPYGKFALVENFWETGFGMASFTLLGPQVIRMPFILTSSYPHEILHNWWGNSVFVDYASGNWCEGLTAYMADHLMQEQRGLGAAHRRDRLQDYASYVREGRDFPLVEFRSRHSAATEAVGYGKTMMGFHMLRRRMGDDRFRAWAARFYREQRGRQASFADVRRSMEQELGQDGGPDLARFFRDWTERPGAAALAVEVGGVEEVEGGFEVRGVLRQTQAGEPFALDVPVALQAEGAGEEAVVAVVRLEAGSTPFALRAPSLPMLLQIDPAFDLFRRLDPREIPASIGQIFGEPRLLAVLPAQASPEEIAAWRTLVESWRSEAHSVEFATDAEVALLPADRAVWLLGRKNRLAPRYFGGGGVAGLAIDDASLVVDGQRVPFAGHTTVAVVRHPQSAERAIGWITVDPALLAALPGLGRKLPHYGKYSYLGFEGGEPTNMVKGQWAASDSPLRVDLRPASARTTALPALALAPRKALAELPAAPAAQPAPPLQPAPPKPVVVRLTTALGEIDLEVDLAHAPISAANFLRSVDAGRYDGGRFHRTVRPDTETRKEVAIEVIQGGVAPEREKDGFPPIPLERTSVTGLKHLDGTLSMARAEPDTATSDFFICIGDQPLLDFGGARNPDGQGFAAFGKVVRGMDVVRQIQAAPALNVQTPQALTPPVQILTARRLP